MGIKARYRIRGYSFHTDKSTSIKNTIRKWAEAAKKNYPTELIVVQKLENGEWHDWRLIEDF